MVIIAQIKAAVPTGILSRRITMEGSTADITAATIIRMNAKAVCLTDNSDTEESISANGMLFSILISLNEAFFSPKKSIIFI